MDQLNSFQIEFNQDPDIVVLGLGGYGIELVKNLRFNADMSPGIILMDRSVEHSNLNEAFSISLGDYSSDLSEGDVVAAGNVVREILPDLEGRLKTVSFAIIVAGLGGGVGSGAALELAAYFRKIRVPTIAFVTKPHPFIEGRKRFLTAAQAESELRNRLDCMISIDSESVIPEIDKQADSVRNNMIEKLQVLMDVLCNPGMMPVDFSRVKNALSCDTSATIITASATGDQRAVEASQRILSDPAVADFLNKPASIVVHVMSDERLTLFELDEAATMIMDNWGAEVDLTYGAATCEGLNLFRIGLIVGDQYQSLPLASVMNDDQDIESGPMRHAVMM